MARWIEPPPIYYEQAQDGEVALAIAAPPYIPRTSEELLRDGIVLASDIEAQGAAVASAAKTKRRAGSRYSVSSCPWGCLWFLLAGCILLAIILVPVCLQYGGKHEKHVAKEPSCMFEEEGYVPVGAGNDPNCENLTPR
ncbi:hypothetical protein LTR85_011181 [Meristemomyces frigidus]|nr:hypothetical protein LTR85_011181 [Meristemomyces frigidus]